MSEDDRAGVEGMDEFVEHLCASAADDQVLAELDTLAARTRYYHEALVRCGYPDGAAHDLVRDWHIAQVRLDADRHFAEWRERRESRD